MTEIVQLRRLYRRPAEGHLGGVAAGIAAHLGVRARVVRLVFVGLAFAGGLGIALYGTYWIVLAPEDGSARRFPAWFEYLAGGLAAVLVIAQFTSSARFGGVLVPVLLAVFGGALIWRQATESDRERWLRLGRDSIRLDGRGRLRMAIGIALVAVGGVVVVARADLPSPGTLLLSILVTVLGLVIVTGPWWMRLVTALRAERTERIRSQERADIAAHLHDSVLQTLALIQRNADSPREVARLARGQERELRHLLYSTPVAAGTLGEELRTVAAEVEDAYGVDVDVVTVGDVALDEALGAAIAAAREAMVNAAKHSGRDDVAVYAEVEQDGVSIFVKDRGVGFDPAEIDESRHGVRGSIIDRVQRHGGTVELHTEAGQGTEVVIRLARNAAEPAR